MNCLRKTYEVGGMMEWHPVFRAGRTSIRVSFTGGHLCGGACTPASYETADPVVQRVIESSDAFRHGRIRIGRIQACSYADGADAEKWGVAEAAAPETPAAPDTCVFEYDNIDDISDFLQSSKGVPLDNLCSSEACFREAERMGVTLRKKVAKQ